MHFQYRRFRQFLSSVPASQNLKIRTDTKKLLASADTVHSEINLAYLDIGKLLPLRQFFLETLE